MLKLMKYEFIHSMRTFFIAFVVFLAGCILLPFFMDGFLTSLPIVSVVFGLGFSFLIIGILFALFISIFVNYDRSMFKRPGYLTLTLPVSTTELILSKVLTTMIWLIIAMFVMVLGFSMMAVVVSVRENAFNLSSFFEFFRMFFESFVEYLTHYPIEFLNNVIMVFAELLILVGGIFFSLTIVRTKRFRKHQLIFGVIIYFAINFFIGWLSGVLFGDSTSTFMSAGTDIVTLITSNLYYILFGVLFTIGTIYIIDHHIEIE